jgi:hypothetical protein
LLSALLPDRADTPIALLRALTALLVATRGGVDVHGVVHRAALLPRAVCLEVVWCLA